MRALTRASSSGRLGHGRPWRRAEEDATRKRRQPAATGWGLAVGGAAGASAAAAVVAAAAAAGAAVSAGAAVDAAGAAAAAREGAAVVSHRLVTSPPTQASPRARVGSGVGGNKRYGVIDGH
mmetsp:Transcript_35473/g.83438  ORF Transcript_35473/g.83438 Transcript_35473/m.83438 type:complete len:122 (+) Transcript_35473:678-1043(+)